MNIDRVIEQLDGHPIIQKALQEHAAEVERSIGVKLHEPTGLRKNEADVPCFCTYGLPPLKPQCPRHGALVRRAEDRSEPGEWERAADYWQGECQRLQALTESQSLLVDEVIAQSRQRVAEESAKDEALREARRITSLWEGKRPQRVTALINAALANAAATQRNG